MLDDHYDEALARFTQASNKEDEGDLIEAIRLYHEAAEMEFTPALTNLGNLYDDKLVPRNPDKAVELYTKAVNLGDAVGAYCLAIHYRNLGQAKEYRAWQRRAAEMGYSEAES